MEYTQTDATMECYM